MRAHGLRTSVTASVVFAALAAGTAVAQQAQVVGRSSAQPELGLKKTAVLSADEQIAQAEAINVRALALGTRLTRMLDEARRDKDILRANCVNRKLTEVNANARSVEQRRVALKEASVVGDDGRRSHEYTVLTVLAAKLDQLNQEATQCLGQSVYEPGASQVITTVSGTVPTIDPTVVGTPPPPPPAVSVPPPTIGPVSPTM